MSAVDRTGPPPAGSESPLELPAFASYRLDNGLRVEITRSSATPDVALRLVLGAGAGATPPELGGLAGLACDLLSEGAEGRDAPAMARWIDGLGAGFSARATYDAAVLSMHAMADQLPDALEYLAAVTVRPDFEEEEVAHRRGMRLDRLRRRRDEAADVAADALGAAVFGEHPYGVPLIGTLGSVERLTGEDLAGFWARRARPDTASLVVAGDIEPSAVLDEVRAQLGDWARPPEPAPPLAAPPPGRAARAGEALLLARPGSRQTELRVGGVGIARGAPDEEAALVMNTLLGGLFNSRVNLNLREDKGWTYGARTQLVRRLEPGPFVLRSAVETEFTEAAFREVLAEFDRLREEPPLPVELELAGNALTRSLPLQFQTASQRAARRAEAVLYGLPDDYWETFPDRISAVTAEEVRAAAERLLDPTGLVLLAVGDVERFATALGELPGVASVAVAPADEANGA